ncbi:MAG: peptide ABC transporter permease [Firmicutes bacterium ML8_F2]|jgi:peptide/nickel transport system permease protein|nr:MAG: peptide ABC transporter permease [Firmicutes bacterium ML8_F2]
MGFYKAWNRLKLSGKVAAAIILILVLMAVFAPFLSWLPHERSSGPPLSPPEMPHLLGTDELGVDIWAMIVYGSRVSLAVGLGTALLAGFCGGVIGIFSAYRGGWIDRLFMRVIDIMIALPNLPVMIVLAAFFGPSLLNIIIVLALFSWSIPARIVRAGALSLKEQPYIKMAAHYGGGTFYLLGKHFIPELLPIITVSMIRLASMAIITEASLAFLGLGDPTSRSWGLIINHAVTFRGIYFTDFWKWWLLYPWLFLTLLVTSLALFGRDLERIADPRVGKLV